MDWLIIGQISSEPGEVVVFISHYAKSSGKPVNMQTLCITLCKCIIDCGIKPVITL